MAPSELERLIASIGVLARAAPAPIILIDGRSGSGKTELGFAVARLLGAQLVQLDDLYPGWDGLDAGSELVHTRVLAGQPWRRWDWSSGMLAEEHRVEPAQPLVVEGSGSLSRASRALATVGVWVELDEPSRKRRALQRDGDLYAPHWDDWAAQEQRFFDRERPDLLADIRVDGARILSQAG